MRRGKIRSALPNLNQIEHFQCTVGESLIFTLFCYDENSNKCSTDETYLTVSVTFTNIAVPENLNERESSSHNNSNNDIGNFRFQRNKLRVYPRAFPFQAKLLLAAAIVTVIMMMMIMKMKMTLIDYGALSGIYHLNVQKRRRWV